MNNVLCPKCGRINTNKSNNPSKLALCPHCSGTCGGRPRKPTEKKPIVGSHGYYILLKSSLTEHELYLYGSSNRGGSVLYHRYVMAKHLNRKLNRGEVVRHINGNKLDCSIENLMLGTDAENKLDHKAAISEMYKWKRIATTMLLLMANGN
jgi:hypothetical protein